MISFKDLSVPGYRGNFDTFLIISTTESSNTYFTNTFSVKFLFRTDSSMKQILLTDLNVC